MIKARSLGLEEEILDSQKTLDSAEKHLMEHHVIYLYLPTGFPQWAYK